MPANHNLRALREVRNVTVRDVELESGRIAEAKGDKWFHISNTRLTQLENDPLSEIGICELFSLSAIYQIRMSEFMRLYFNVDVEELDKYNLIAFPNKLKSRFDTDCVDGDSMNQKDPNSRNNSS